MKKLIIGLDLSLNSTGITTTFLNGVNNGKYMNFYRIVFDKQKAVRGFSIREFQNILTIPYRMPSNLLPYDLLLNETDINNQEQIEVTLKSMVQQKKIGKIINENIKAYNPDSIYFSIENYVLPKFSGPTALKNVSGLIMLQGFVREIIIRICLENKIQFKLLTEPPRTLKAFFSTNGNAEKIDMLKAFFKYYNGKTLLPNVTENDVEHVNDVIDSFALVMFTYSKIIKSNK